MSSTSCCLANMPFPNFTASFLSGAFDCGIGSDRVLQAVGMDVIRFQISDVLSDNVAVEGLKQRKTARPIRMEGKDNSTL